jgi:hypothetical protein
VNATNIVGNSGKFAKIQASAISTGQFYFSTLTVDTIQSDRISTGSLLVSLLNVSSAVITNVNALDISGSQLNASLVNATSAVASSITSGSLITSSITTNGLVTDTLITNSAQTNSIQTSNLQIYDTVLGQNDTITIQDNILYINGQPVIAESQFSSLNLLYVSTGSLEGSNISSFSTIADSVYTNNLTVNGLTILSGDTTFSGQVSISSLSLSNLSFFDTESATNTIIALPSTLAINNTLFIDNAGHIGINVSSTTYALEVNSTMKITDTLYASTISTQNLQISSFSLPTQFSVNTLFAQQADLQGETLIHGSLNISSLSGVWVSVGSSIQTSPDGDNWQETSASQGNAVAWNGTVWVSVGSSIQTSTDGYNWQQTSASQGTGVAWNGSFWLSVHPTLQCLTSIDGYTWTNSTLSYANGIAWNGRIWVAVGSTIQVSADGYTWSPAINGFSVAGYSVAWNGRIWVAVGQDATNTIQYSYDGLNWIPSTTGFSGGGYGIAWNGRNFVAVGTDPNSIKISYDGLVWIDCSSPLSSFTGIAWNGSYWLASGTSIYKSTDGFNWSLVNSNQANGLGFGGSLATQIVTNNLTIDGTSIPNYLTSTNQIATGFSSLLVLNNTVYIDMTNNRVGINTTAPNATLDINGTLAKTAGSFDIRHPDPVKADQGYRLRHCFVESPTRGDNIYRWLFSTQNNEFTFQLPSYFQYLNENPTCHVSPVDTFGRGRASVNKEGTYITLNTTEDGLWNVLCIATRKDKDAIDYFDEKGVEYR